MHAAHTASCATSLSVWEVASKSRTQLFVYTLLEDVHINEDPYPDDHGRDEEGEGMAQPYKGFVPIQLWEINAVCFAYMEPLHKIDVDDFEIVKPHTDRRDQRHQHQHGNNSPEHQNQLPDFSRGLGIHVKKKALEEQKPAQARFYQVVFLPELFYIAIVGEFHLLVIIPEYVAHNASMLSLYP